MGKKWPALKREEEFLGLVGELDFSGNGFENIQRIF